MNIIKNIIIGTSKIAKIMVSNQSIIIVYFYRRLQREIQFAEINSISVNAQIDYIPSLKGFLIEKCLIDLQIETTTDTVILKLDSMNGPMRRFPYQNILDLIDVASILPNFKYNITGNALNAINDIQYYALNKKHLPIITRCMGYLKDYEHYYNKFKCTLFTIGTIIQVCCIIFIIVYILCILTILIFDL